MRVDHPDHLARLCRWIRYAATTVFAISALADVLFWTAPSLFDGVPAQVSMVIDSAVPATIAHMPFAQKMVELLISIPALALMGLAVLRLNRMLKRFERKEFFTRGATADLSAFSGSILGFMVFSILETPLRALVASAYAGSDHPALSVTFTSDEIWIVLICVLFHVIARILDEGRKLADENREFV